MNGKSLACWLMVATICPQVLIVSPNHAEVVSEVASRITDINTTTSGDRLNLILNFAGSDRPQITYRSQGKAWIAELNGAQLQLGNGNASFAKTNPAPGISAIEATQTAANKVAIRVTISNPEAVKSSVIRRDTLTGLMFTVATATPDDKGQTNNASNRLAQVPITSKPTVPAQSVTRPVKPAAQETQTTTNSQLSSEPSTQVLSTNNSDSKPTTVGQAVIQPELAITSSDGKTRVAQTTVPPDPQVPPAVASPVQPQVQGRTQGVVPPFRKLITPPVGDIAVSTVKLRPDLIDLGSAERVPRISLRNAPAIEVLTLIGRVAGLSVVSAEGGALSSSTTPTPTSGGTTGAATTGLNQLIPVLDIENESAQEVFNNILRITGLQANRIGRTVFVATRLPVSLQNLVTRSYRLNQITVGDASSYLVGLGAERVVTRQRAIPGVQAATAVGSGGATIVAPVQLESVPVLETLSGVTDNSKTILKGLQVVAEERSNSVTLIGAPKLVEFAEAQLARLDLRKRQVAVNVRVVEVTLSDNQTFGGSFQFSPSNPNGGGTTTSIDSNSSLLTPNTLGINFNNIASALVTPQQFIASLNAQIAVNRGKVITDPTLTIQEGETATVSLTNDVVSKVENVVTNATGGQVTVTQTVTLTKAGLVLNVKVLRIDDNGFINLSVAPFVSAPNGVVSLLSGGFVTLISERKLESGQVRLRDGQTLILSGVISDTDRSTVSKVPILGDLPIIGALFRQETNVNQRNEVVVVVTPRIVDDSERANWGYTYQPGTEVQKVLDSNRIKPQ
ncbi:AMIN domain-containing protein [Tumidithrix helvetica PCC 7403]|uniref:secretin N-terminal domain-containing protein n=1 Tax=Tumidithrix helvetica TaxID=3457545 RepID=UPI003C9CCA3B